jgi:proteic killer suppression protein
MIIGFQHKALAQFFSTGKAYRLPADHLPRLRLILAILNAARAEKDFHFPGSHAHQLTGNLKGFWSVRVNKNWRIIFRFDGEDVHDVNLVDYH